LSRISNVDQRQAGMMVAAAQITGKVALVVAEKAIVIAGEHSQLRVAVSSVVSVANC
jgi:hypothetical protein